MENPLKLTKLNKLQLRCYERLGIRHLRRFILKLEALRHRKDGLHNFNYHPANSRLSGLRSFPGSLLYNTVLHLISLLLGGVYLVLCLAMGLHYPWLHMLMGTVGVLNLLCLILQHYLFLKTKAAIVIAQQRRSRRLEKLVGSITCLPENPDREMGLAQQMYDCLTRGGCCLLSEEDAPALSRMAALLSAVPTAAPGIQKDVPIRSLLRSTREDVIAPAERRISRLQRLWGVPQADSLLFDCTIVTGGPESEAAFRKLFPRDDRDELLLRAEALTLAYRKAGQRHG